MEKNKLAILTLVALFGLTTTPTFAQDNIQHPTTPTQWRENMQGNKFGDGFRGATTTPHGNKNGLKRKIQNENATTTLRGGEKNNENKNRNASTTPIFQGNGQPIIAGTISTISGNTLTITNKSNASYIVDVTNAKIYLGNSTSTISILNVGDSVIVQGTINGTSITASNVIDQIKPSNNVGSTTPRQNRGFLGSIGNFFAHLFGF